jgi:UDP-2-acetamido-2-deoxy-ribo-hexuluronate aminotransferase
MTGWDREYLANKSEYLELFDRVMQKEQETNVEFLEKNLAEITNRKYVVTCNSGTDALSYSLMSMGIKPGDEVITSNFSWISTASCISMVGATPVFCDIDLDNYHLSFNSVKRMISDKTKAIVYPHLFGNMSDIKKIKHLGIPIIEDACQSLGSSYNGVVAGSIGDISTLSFNANKVVAGISGGGAILTDEKDRAEFFKKIRKHGNNEFLGFNSKMLLFNAEVINFRLKRMNEWQTKRQEIAKIYDNALKDLPVVTQKITNGLNHNYHKYVVRFENKTIRDKVKDRVLNAKIHYEKPLSENIMYKNITHKKDDCINCQIVTDTILTLPLHPYLTTHEIRKMLNIIMVSV